MDYVYISVANGDGEEEADDEQEENKGGDDGAAEVTLVCNLVWLVQRMIHACITKCPYGLVVVHNLLRKFKRLLN